MDKELLAIFPIGRFLPYRLGKHCIEAERICNEIGLYEGIFKAKPIQCRRFLSEEAMCLHNPSKKTDLQCLPLVRRKEIFFYGYF